MTVAKAIPPDLIDSLLSDYKKPEDLIGEHGLLKQLTKILVERALEAEMAEHLGHAKNAPIANPDGNADPKGTGVIFPSYLSYFK